MAASLANMPAHRPEINSANLQTSQTQAAELLQMSPRSVATAAKVERSAPTEVVEAVKAGNISLNMAAQVAEMTDKEQEEFNDVPANQVKEVAKES